MALYRTFLAAMLVIILGYTVGAVASDGWNLIPFFLGNIVAVNWNGQFNLDFLMLLWTCAIWVAWRSGFTGAGIATAVVGHLFGMIFFASYLLYLTYVSGGDARRIALGVHADQATR